MFIKAFYVDRHGQPFGCNTPVTQNDLTCEWHLRPSADQPKPLRPLPDRSSPPLSTGQSRARRGALLDYSRGGNHANDIARTIRDYLVRIEPGSDDLLLGKAYFGAAQALLASSYFLIERSQPLPTRPPRGP
jgi:hypothetical protein